jgi:sRNA-binding regulator protein Hfq
MSDPVHEFLSASCNEQLPVTIYFNCHHLTGTVTAIGEDAVEVRQENRRSVIRMETISAVSRE